MKTHAHNRTRAWAGRQESRTRAALPQRQQSSLSNHVDFVDSLSPRAILRLPLADPTERGLFRIPDWLIIPSRDPATKMHVARQLQRTHGNAFLARALRSRAVRGQANEIKPAKYALTPIIQRAGFTSPKTSKLPASPAPWNDVWVGGNEQGVVFEVARNGIAVRVLRKYGQLGIKDWRTLVCGHDVWPNLPELRGRMEAAAAAVAAQNPRVIPDSAAAHRVKLVVFADSDTAYYVYKGSGAILFRTDFKPGDYTDAVVHELSHGLFEFHRVGATSGAPSAVPDEVLLAVESLYGELANTTKVPLPTAKFDPKNPPPLKGNGEQQAAGLVMFTDVLWAGSGGHPWEDAHELFASAYAGRLQAPELLTQIIAYYQQADPAIVLLAKKMFEALEQGANRKVGESGGTHITPIGDLIAKTTAEVGWAAEPQSMYRPVTESTYCLGAEEPELDF